MNIKELYLTLNTLYVNKCSQWISTIKNNLKSKQTFKPFVLMGIHLVLYFITNAFMSVPASVFIIAYAINIITHLSKQKRNQNGDLFDELKSVIQRLPELYFQKELSITVNTCKKEIITLFKQEQLIKTYAEGQEYLFFYKDNYIYVFSDSPFLTVSHKTIILHAFAGINKKLLEDSSTLDKETADLPSITKHMQIISDQQDHIINQRIHYLLIGLFNKLNIPFSDKNLNTFYNHVIVNNETTK